jgi:hypothetical protein
MRAGTSSGIGSIAMLASTVLVVLIAAPTAGMAVSVSPAPRAVEADSVLRALSRSFDLGSGSDLSRISLTTRAAVVAGDCDKGAPAKLLSVVVRGDGTRARVVDCDGERETSEGEQSAKRFSRFAQKVLSAVGSKLARRSGLSEAEHGDTKSLVASQTKARAKYARAQDPPPEGAVKTITVARGETSITRYGEG